MENRTDYERNRSELDHRYAHPEWMKDNVGWVIGAISIVLIIGGIYYVSADHPRTTSIPDDATTGQSTPPPMSPTPPVSNPPSAILAGTVAQHQVFHFRLVTRF